MAKGTISISDIKSGQNLTALVREVRDFYGSRVSYYEYVLKRVLKNKYDNLFVLFKKPIEKCSEDDKKQLIDIYLKTLGLKEQSKKELTSKDYVFVQNYLEQYFTKKACEEEVRAQNSLAENRKYVSKNIILTFNKLNLQNDIRLIEQTAKKCLDWGIDTKLVLCGDLKSQSVSGQANYVYSAQEIKTLIELNNKLVSYGMGKQILVDELSEVESCSDIGDCWKLEEVINANREIDKIVKTIKKCKVSPYETMIYIHKYLTANFAYKDDDMTKAAFIVGAFSQDKDIVCSGYSSLTKAIIDRLDSPDLKAEFMTGTFYLFEEKQEIERYAHSQCVITIKDKKYNIFGTYVEDASRDSKMLLYKYGRGFANFMMPVCDMDNYKHYIYDQYTAQNRYQALSSTDGVDSLYKRKEYLDLVDDQARYDYVLKNHRQDVAQKYGRESQPIDLETFRKALRVICQNTYNDADKSEIDSMIDNEIQKSTIFAMKSFSKNAQNMFVRNYFSCKNNKSPQQIDKSKEYNNQ